MSKPAECAPASAMKAATNSDLAVALRCDGQGPTDLDVSGRSNVTNVLGQRRSLNGLNVIEVDGARVLQAFGLAHDYLARCAVDRRGDGRDHDRVQEADDVIAAKDEHGAPLVATLEGVHPYLVASYGTG